MLDSIEWEDLITGKTIKKIENMPKNTIGFIYLIQFIYNDKIRMYIGKKHLYNTRRLIPRDNGQPRKGHVEYVYLTKHRIKYEIVRRESNWKTYQGSCELCKQLKPHKKLIIDYADSEKLLTYLEARHLFMYDVLRNERFINDNIDGRYFRQWLTGDSNNAIQSDKT